MNALKLWIALVALALAASAVPAEVSPAGAASAEVCTLHEGPKDYVACQERQLDCYLGVIKYGPGQVVCTD